MTRHCRISSNLTTKYDRSKWRNISHLYRFMIGNASQVVKSLNINSCERALQRESEDKTNLTRSFTIYFTWLAWSTIPKLPIAIVFHRFGACWDGFYHALLSPDLTRGCNIRWPTDSHDVIRIMSVTDCDKREILSILSKCNPYIWHIKMLRNMRHLNVT